MKVGMANTRAMQFNETFAGGKFLLRLDRVVFLDLDRGPTLCDYRDLLDLRDGVLRHALQDSRCSLYWTIMGK